MIMNARHFSSVIENTQDLLKLGGELTEYEANLLQLGKLVTLTSTSSVARDTLSKNTSLLHLCHRALANVFPIEIQSECTKEIYIRNVRGLVLFVRNISVSASAHFEFSQVLMSMKRFGSRIDSTNPCFAGCLQSYLQLLANLCMKQGSDIESNTETFIEIVRNSTLRHIERIEDPDLKTPFNVILNSFSRGIQKEFFSLKDTTKFVEYIVNRSLNHLDDLSSCTDLLPLLQVLIAHKKFGMWIEQHNQAESLEQILNLCQLVLSSKEGWNFHETLVIATWCLNICSGLASQSVVILNSDITDGYKSLHLQVVRSLDIMSELCKFDGVTEFLEQRQALQMFISLLRAIHENTKVKTLKKEPLNTLAEKHTNMQFPIVKSLTIEILAFMCHQSPTNQDAMRELHGLELILSNCVIDDNNPYIKEHAILCLKYLLHNNQKNQEFVALLEAKQVVDAETLSQAGYAVSVNESQ